MATESSDRGRTKHLLLLTRNPRLDAEAFQQAWALRRTDCGINRDRLLSGFAPFEADRALDFDGIATANSADDLLREVVALEAHDLVDPTHCHLAAAEEIVVRPGVGSGLKCVSLLCRRDGIEHGEFLDYWRFSHAPLLQQSTAFFSSVTRYVQNHIRVGSWQRLAGDDPPLHFDGLVEIWFASAAMADKAFSSEEYRAQVSGDERRFIGAPRPRWTAYTIC